jgi:hypothetical protein
VKFETNRSFERDYDRLSAAEQKLLRKALAEFVPACDRYAADSAAKWPAGLRVKDVEGAPGIWEMTWSFSGPDGRATFEWAQIDGALGVRWRRIGGHSIFRVPSGSTGANFASNRALGPDADPTRHQPPMTDSHSGSS